MEPVKMQAASAATSAGAGAQERSNLEASGAVPVRIAAPPKGRKESLEKELGKVEGKKWLRRLLILLGVVAVIGGVVVWRAKTKPPPPPKYVLAELSKGDVAETVQSTGTVKPLIEVTVGAQVSGRITKVLVDFNSIVKKGELLAEIDTTLYDAAMDQNIGQINSAKASVASAEATVTTTKIALDRIKKLVAEGLGSQADQDSAQGSYDVALANVASAKANVAQLGAALKSSKANLEYTHIYAPIDGMVTNRAIDPGQTVAASFQAPTLFVIAQDLSKMRVLADVDEADVGHVRDGMLADITVDAFPGEKFKGRVSQVRFSPTTNSGVTTYAAVIDVENPELKLRPGMTATVKVKSSEVTNVTRIPNAALRFKPSPALDKDGKKVAQPPLPELPPSKGRVYVLTDETPGKEVAVMKEVDLGITDGINTELKTDLGTQKVVIDENDDPAAKKGRF